MSYYANGEHPSNGRFSQIGILNQLGWQIYNRGLIIDVGGFPSLSSNPNGTQIQKTNAIDSSRLRIGIQYKYTVLHI